MDCRRLLYLVILLLVVRNGFGASSASAAAEPTSRWIVVYRNSSAKTVALRHRTANMRHNYRILPGIAGDFTASELAKVKKDPTVALLVKDSVRHLMAGAASARGAFNPRYATQSGSTPIVPYGVDLVHARDVWSYTRGSGVKIADIDTGIDLTHPDLPCVIASTTFTNQSVQDTDGHGTHTSGTMAAPGNGGGVEGVAPDAGLLIAQVFDTQGNAYDSNIIAAIDWAVQNGANVINMSLGGTDYDAALNQACATAAAAGVVLVASAGNDDASAPSYPASYSSVISVAAVDRAKQRASFSNYGSTVDLCAPGMCVLSTVRVGTGWLTSANWNGSEHQTSPITGSANGTVTASAVYCGLGNPSDFPVSVRGKIAHVRRGTLTFQQKVDNAVAAGAVGVIISNNVPDTFNAVLSQNASLVVVVASQADGDDLLASDGVTATITNQNPSDYASYDGTSMSAPHVSGVAALLIGARHGHISPTEVQNAMQNSAQDLGSTGRDDYYGYGLVDAMAALGNVIPIIQTVTAAPTTVAPGSPVTVTVQLSTASGLASVTANGTALSGSGTTRTGNIAADSSLGVHTIDIAVADTWGNVNHNTSLTYTTSASVVLPSLAISSPSATATASGPISYSLTYANATSVTLSAGNVTLNRTGNASGNVSVSGSGSTSRTVTISGITGNGTLGISIAAGSASNSSGNAPAAGPSSTFAVSNQAPVVVFTSPTTGSATSRNCSNLTIAGTASDSYGIASVTWAMSGGLTGTCSGTTSWSASGLVLVPGQNTITVTATDTLGNRGNVALVVNYLDSHPGSAWQGAAMVSLPIIPDSNDPKPPVGFNGNGWFAYDPLTSGYIGYSDTRSWFSPASATPGRGFWAYFPTGGGGSPCGTIPSQTQPTTIHLHQGWNLIGDPYVSSLTWDVEAITVVKTVGAGPVALMTAGDAVDDYAWGWDPVKGAYYLVMDTRFNSAAVGHMSPWQAYWLKASKDCDLVIPAP